MHKKTGHAITIVNIPDEYPSRRLAASYCTGNAMLAYAIAEATDLESRYEQLTKDIKAGGSGLLSKAEALVEVEDHLMQRYYAIAEALDPVNAAEKARHMLFETSLLAKQRTKLSGRQV